MERSIFLLVSRFRCHVVRVQVHSGDEDDPARESQHAQVVNAYHSAGGVSLSGIQKWNARDDATLGRRHNDRPRGVRNVRSKGKQDL
jgi:hypothetical protein